MKPITKTANPCKCETPKERAEAAANAAAPRTEPAPAQAPAQCCAKVSHATMGCHD